MKAELFGDLIDTMFISGLTQHLQVFLLNLYFPDWYNYQRSKSIDKMLCELGIIYIQLVLDYYKVLDYFRLLHVCVFIKSKDESSEATKQAAI